MSSNGQSDTMSALYSDGVPILSLAAALPAERRSAAQQAHRYWASGEAHISATRREVMEVSFGVERLVNHIQFRVSRLPLVLSAEYLDEVEGWKPLTHPVHPDPDRDPTTDVPVGPAVRLSVSESVPGIVKSSREENPLHSGIAHWLDESWKVSPVLTSRVRFVIVRNHRGTPPVDVHGRTLPYSVAIKDATFGYRVSSTFDTPKIEGEWANSTDMLGSQVTYSTYEQPAQHAIDGDSSKYWRSEPQPFPFAVVNMHLDLRGPDGTAPVLDRFFVDPITPGVHCNLYYSNSEVRTFRGSSDPVPAPFRTEVGVPGVTRDAATDVAQSVDLGPTVETGVGIAAAHTRMRFDRSWWVGIDGRMLADPHAPGEHPLVSMGSTRIVQDEGVIRVTTQTGEVAEVALNPVYDLFNSQFTLVVAYTGDEDIVGSPIVRISYCLRNHEPLVTEVAVSALLDSTAQIKIGLHPDPADTTVAAVAVRGLVVKSELLTLDVEEWFHRERQAFVADPATVFAERGTARNAIVRMHPEFVSDDNPFGVVGGANPAYDQMDWVPVPRDYVLKQGYMHLSPTKAAFWKFEMTGLLPEVYENFVPIDRIVQVFPTHVASAYDTLAGPADENSAPSGAQTAGNMAATVSYADLLDAVRRQQQAADATSVLVVRDPVQARQIASTGWVWTYQPWHAGSRSPRFPGVQKHRYDELEIRHTTKVGFFVGLKEIRPHRVDYTFPDDTPEYIERFDDAEFIDLTDTNGMVFEDGGVRATSSKGQITSKALASYRNVRGIQFATQESDSVQVMEDYDFRNINAFKRWEAFGDATLIRRGYRRLTVTRGWHAFTYGDLERMPVTDTFGEMEDFVYAELEGGQESGLPEGGVVSKHYVPLGAGEITARVHVSVDQDLHAPILLELVSVVDDRVLSRAERTMKRGESVTMSASVSGTVTINRLYGDLESLEPPATTYYADLEEFSYAELESSETAQSGLYIRVSQEGPYRDSFDLHQIALYDSPIAWFFSNDDGESWQQAVYVRNNPYGVLTFPRMMDPGNEQLGRQVRWRAKTYREGTTISALHIRPWYGVRGRGMDPAHGMDAVGPNQSLRDLYPFIHMHPMWQATFNPVEEIYKEPPPPFWRNLSITPSGEWPEGRPPSEAIDGWSAEGGEVDYVRIIDEDGV